MTLIFDEFRYGMGMEAEFTVPESGKTSVLLLKDPNNYMVQVVPKWDKKILVISTKIDGEFGNSITIDEFTAASGSKMIIRIEGHQKYFAVFVDNKLINKYPHRLPIGDIKKAKLYGEEGSLIKLSALYQPVTA